MKLALWTYEGPPHVGAMRVATAMKGLHYVLHAPQGDTYADLLFTMIERRDHRPPVTYTTFQARDLGSDTADLFREAARAAYERHRPEAMIVGASCTAELIQDDPGGLASALGLPIPVIALDLPSYQRREHFGADETFYRIVRALAGPMARTERVSCNVLGPTALGFRHRDDAEEVAALLDGLGVEINAVAPMGARPADIARLGAAHFNVVLYPETAESAARHLERAFGQPCTRTVPIGAEGTRAFLAEVEAIVGRPMAADESAAQAALVVGLGGLDLPDGQAGVRVRRRHARGGGGPRRRARDRLRGLRARLLQPGGRAGVRALAKELGCEALVTDDYLEVEAAIERLAPELILGTQMERHIAKRLGIASAVISAPAHVQDFPARHSPVMGHEGANVLFDTMVHPLVMGLEDHLLHMFRDDFEFGEAEAPAAGAPAPAAPAGEVVWLADAERELRKVPFFVRGKARRNTEAFAAARGVAEIGIDTLYEAKAHHAR